MKKRASPSLLFLVLPMLMANAPAPYLEGTYRDLEASIVLTKSVNNNYFYDVTVTNKGSQIGMVPYGYRNSHGNDEVYALIRQGSTEFSSSDFERTGSYIITQVLNPNETATYKIISTTLFNDGKLDEIESYTYDLPAKNVVKSFSDVTFNAELNKYTLSLEYDSGTSYGFVANATYDNKAMSFFIKNEDNKVKSFEAKEDFDISKLIINSIDAYKFSSFHDGQTSPWQVLGAFAKGFGVFVLVCLGICAIGGVTAAIVIPNVRRNRRKRKENAGN